MGFTLYNEETGSKYHYNRNRINFGKRELEGTLSPVGETIPLDVARNLMYVSRDHIRIFKRCHGYEIIDLSKNGTCINGKRIQGGIAELMHGDLIRLGPEDMDEAIALYFLENGGAERFIEDSETGKQDRGDKK